MDEPSLERAEALDALAAARGEYLNFLARRVGREEDREDILQQAYARASERVETLKDTSLARAWFYTILKRAMADFYARRSRDEVRRGELELAAVTDPAESASEAPAGLCHCGERIVRDRLPEQTAELVIRVAVGEEKPGEVAADLGLSANHARVKLHRAFATLRQELHDHCGHQAVAAQGYRGFLDCECTGC